MEKKVEVFTNPGDERRTFICPGCKEQHSVRVKGENRGPVWGYNWNDSAPTFTPSLLVRWVSIPDELEEDENGKLLLQADGRVKGAKDEICHSFIREGRIQFLNDCTHKLAGQTVDLLDIE